MIKAALFAAAIVLAPVTASSQEATENKDPGAISSGKSTTQNEAPNERSQVTLRSSIAEAIDRVMAACDDDIDEFCAGVTPGGRHVALCMLAHEDQISGRCRSALIRTSRQLKRNIDRVGEGCLKEIQTLCGEAGKIPQCLDQKKGSLTASCQAIVGTLARKASMLKAQLGMPVFSSDNKRLGQIVAISRDPDGKIQSVQIDIGRNLGIGTKLVTVTVDKIAASSGLNVNLSESEVRVLPEAKRQ